METEKNQNQGQNQSPESSDPPEDRSDSEQSELSKDDGTEGQNFSPKGHDQYDKMELLRQILKDIEKNLANALRLIDERPIFSSDRGIFKKSADIGRSSEEGDNKIIEGVFDGQNMVGPDGKKYSISVNYASKSKLLEGDILKLTIMPNGAFIYKQIGPQKNVRLRGLLVKSKETEECLVLTDGKMYKVLPASISYFKGEAGDEVIILVPESKSSAWAAVENIIKKPPENRG